MKNITLVLITVLGLMIGCGSSGDSVSTQNDLGNGTFSIGSMLWQDNEEVFSKEIKYEDTNEYCTNLALGGYSDWRLPSISEYKELFTKVNLLKYSSNKDDYLYWTNWDTGDATRIFNMYNGYDVIQYKNLIHGTTYNIRCVRSDDNQSNKYNPISYTSKMKDIFQQGYYATINLGTNYSFRLNREKKTFKLSNGDSEISGNYDIHTGDSIEKNEILITLKQGSNVIYKMTYLGAYNKYSIFIKVENPILNEIHYRVMSPHSRNEGLDYNNVEEKYNELFK